MLSQFVFVLKIKIKCGSSVRRPGLSETLPSLDLERVRPAPSVALMSMESTILTLSRSCERDPTIS
jgi:hypothetical protein